MLGLFSLKSTADKYNSIKGTENIDQAVTESVPLSRSNVHKASSEIFQPLVSQRDATSMTSDAALKAERPVWKWKKPHDDSCECCLRPLPMQQSLDEMEWERGLWGLASLGKIERLAELLRKGHDPNSRDSAGFAPLHYAARAGYLSTCKLLLEWRADVDSAILVGGATPLMRSCVANQLQVTELLLSSGASPAARDFDGRTALHKAVEGGSAGALRLLLAHSATDLLAFDNRCCTALDLARDRAAAAASSLESAAAMGEILALLQAAEPGGGGGGAAGAPAAE